MVLVGVQCSSMILQTAPHFLTASTCCRTFGASRDAILAEPSRWRRWPKAAARGRAGPDIFEARGEVIK